MAGGEAEEEEDPKLYHDGEDSPLSPMLTPENALLLAESMVANASDFGRSTIRAVDGAYFELSCAFGAIDVPPELLEYLMSTMGTMASRGYSWSGIVA